MSRENPHEREPPYIYECVECGHRIEADERPGECPECGGKMQNLSVPREQ